MTTVARLMTKELVTLSEEDGVARAMTLFSELPIRHLPVTDGNRLVGMVSQRDALSWSSSGIDAGAFSAERVAKQAEGTFVAEVMVRDVITIAPTATVIEAARTLLDAGVGALPVVGDDRLLVGIITETDLLAHLISCELTSAQGVPAPAATEPVKD